MDKCELRDVKPPGLSHLSSLEFVELSVLGNGLPVLFYKKAIDIMDLY